MPYQTHLETLRQSPNHRLLIQHSPFWVCLRTYSPASRMLLEVSGNKHLPKASQLSEAQTTQLAGLELKSRRQGYSLGKLLPAVQPADIPHLSLEIERIFSEIFNVTPPSEISCVPSPPLNIYNRELLGKMKESARNKDHLLRLQLYTLFIDCTFIALASNDGSLIQCDTITGFPCFGVFTDEKHALQYDPRGLCLEPMSALMVIQKCIAQGAGSLWINPKGETRGELYKNEIEELWRRTRRLHNQ